MAFSDSFDFSGQPLVVALRMFLSAFRLPGEAQQIDRVVQAFADAAFACCLEAKSGVLPTTDTACPFAHAFAGHCATIAPNARSLLAFFLFFFFFLRVVL